MGGLMPAGGWGGRRIGTRWMARIMTARGWPPWKDCVPKQTTATQPRRKMAAMALRSPKAGAAVHGKGDVEGAAHGAVEHGGDGDEEVAGDDDEDGKARVEGGRRRWRTRGLGRGRCWRVPRPRSRRDRSVTY